MQFNLGLVHDAVIGDAGRVQERIQAFQAAGVTRLSVNPVGEDPLRVIEQIRAWVD